MCVRLFDRPSARVNLLGTPAMDKTTPGIQMHVFCKSLLIGIILLNILKLKNLECMYIHTYAYTYIRGMHGMHEYTYVRIYIRTYIHTYVCWILEMSNPQIREKLTGGDKSFCLWHETGDDVTTGLNLSGGQFLNVLPKKHMSENSCVTYTTIMFKLSISLLTGGFKWILDIFCKYLSCYLVVGSNNNNNNI